MPDNLATLCERIDTVLAREQVRLEDVNNRTRLFRPLEEAVLPLNDAPLVSGSTAGKIATLLWCKYHPQQADLDWLLGLLDDESPLVRLSVTDAVAATLESHQRWSEPGFSALIREALQIRREVETSPVITYNLDEIALKLSNLARPPRPKRPQLVLNPYVAGLPVQDPKKFFGRQDVFRMIENSLGRREGVKSIVIYGARRTGKTSILYQIKNGILGESFLSVYIDMQAFAGTSLPFFLHSLLLSTVQGARERKLLKPEKLEELEEKLKELIEGREWQIVREFFNEFLGELEGTTLLLLIDEFELLEGFFEKNLDFQLRALLDRELKLCAIFASSRKVETLRKTRFLNLIDTADYKKISFLGKDDALRLIREPAERLIRYVEGVPEMILRYTAGHPFYTQLLCQTVFDFVKTGGTVTAEHLQQAVRQFLQNPSPHLILTWNGLELEQQVVGSTLAEQSSDGSFKQPAEIIRRLRREEYPVRLRQGEVQQALTVLRDIDWVEKEEEVQAYRYTMDLVRRWVTESRSVAGLVEEQREHIFSKVAVFWRQMLAWTIDFGIFGAVVALALFITKRAPAANTTRWWVASAAMAWVLYFILPLLIAKSTLGLHILSLRIVSTLAGPPSVGRLLLYGVIGVVRFMIMILLVYALLKFINPDEENRLTYLWGFIASAVVTGVDVLMMLFSRRHQGLYDTVAGTLTIWEKPAED